MVNRLIPGRLPGQGAPLDPNAQQPPVGPPPGLLGPNGAPLPPSGGMPPIPPGLMPTPMMGPQMMGPTPPGPMPMMGGPDMLGPQSPMLGPQSPMLGGQNTSAPPDMPEEPPDDGKPVYPAWLMKDGTPNPPKKPTTGFIQSAISNDELVFGQLCQRFLDDLKFYRLEGASVFDNLPQEDVELFTSAEPATQVNKVANMIAGIPALVQWMTAAGKDRSEADEDQAEDLEDAAQHFLDLIDRYHQEDGNASLRWEQVWSSLVYGRVVSRILPDPLDPDFPWEYRLLDPATVFPTFGGKRGLIRVTQVYRWPLDKVLTAFPDAQGKFDKTFAKDDGTLDLGREGTMREYWDCWYRWAEFDGEEVLPVTAHELGYVPFVYTLAPGEMGSASSPSRRRDSGLTAREIKAGWAGNGAGSTGQDLVYKGQSFFHAMRPILRQEEAVLSLQMTSIKQSLNPPMALENAFDAPPTAFDFRSGTTNMLKPGQKPVPLLNSARPTDTAPVLASLRENRVKGMLPDHVFGAEDGSNVSGFAVESLIAAAKDRIQPYITLAERHLAGVIDLAFREFRDIGWTVVEDGEWEVPAPKRGTGLPEQESPAMPPMQAMQQLLGALGGGDPSGLAAAFNAGGQDIAGPSGPQDRPCLTRAKILSLGPVPTVRLHSVPLQQMTAMANVASMLIDKKVWSRYRAMGELAIQNPDLEMRRILSEDAQTNPKMLETVEFPKALWQRGDIDGWLAYVAINLLPQMMAGAAGQQQGPPGQGGPPQLPGGPQTQQGASQPQVGQMQQGPTGPGNGAM